MKVFLIGFMGSGKSTIGKLLSDRLGYSFIETDSLVENSLKKSIPQIFASAGETAFRQAENKAMLSILRQAGNMVISTGGGTPCHFGHMERMNENGNTIYLKRSATDLYKFLKKDHKIRPVLAGMNDLKSGIISLLKNREEFYNQAWHVVEIEANEKDEDVVGRIIIRLNLN